MFDIIALARCFKLWQYAFGADFVFRQLKFIAQCITIFSA